MLSRLAAVATLAVATVATVPARAQTQDWEWQLDTLLRADLHGDGDMHGHVRWVQRHNDRIAVDILIVMVWNVEPGEPLNVYVNDSYVDTAVADETGFAHLHLRFPDMSAPDVLDTVEVGPLTGVFFDRHPDTPTDVVQRYITRTRVNGDGTSALVRYVERIRNRNITQTFTVDVDGPFIETLDIRLNGDIIARVAPPSSGGVLGTGSDAGRRVRYTADGLAIGQDGALRLRTDWAIGPGDGTAIPMPDWFPTIIPGDVITVGPASESMSRLGWVPPVE